VRNHSCEGDSGDPGPAQPRLAEETAREDRSENPGRTVGRADYSAIDFLEDVKCACAREGVRFDDDIFNELVG
jgi:hypothetical protein